MKHTEGYTLLLPGVGRSGRAKQKRYDMQIGPWRMRMSREFKEEWKGRTLKTGTVCTQVGRQGVVGR